MNQHQRKFLLEEIEKQYKRERSELADRKPKPPSLNNYLIAAILDGTARMQPQKEVEKMVRQRVRDLGKEDSFVTHSHDRWGNRRGNDDDRYIDVVSIPALLLFEPPKEYAEMRKKYESDLEKWQAEERALEASIAAMRIKVQVGSDKALEALVEQADQICSMSLTVSSKLLASKPAGELPSPKPAKELPAGQS